MNNSETVLRFNNVFFSYKNKPILVGANFSIKRDSKVTIIGQNGAGKSTIFKLITKVLKPDSGEIFMDQNATVGIAQQVVPAEKLNLTLKEFFETAFEEPNYAIDKDIAKVMAAVNLSLPLDKQVKDLSGGQKARLLLAYSIIQDPDILLLDEPTNNLDRAGIEHLTMFLINYPKTVIVISHDSDFLNSFTDGVLNLDVHTKLVEQYQGNYYDLLDQIAIRLEKDRMQNARMQKQITENWEKVNFFKNKSAQMNKLANKLEAKVEEAKENMVEARQEDKTIKPFVIEEQHIPRLAAELKSVTFLRDGQPITRPVEIRLRKGDRLLLAGPNGIGKSTLLKSMLDGTAEGTYIDEDTRIGYYSQDFSELNFEETVQKTLLDVMPEKNMKDLYSTASAFLITSDMMQNQVGTLSEGQKGLLCYARFVLQKPGILIMDEPTNHINFRHLPVIAQALVDYKGAMIIISHDEGFVKQLKIEEVLDLSKL
jgi:ATP-binding cassette subfamily F protein 3